MQQINADGVLADKQQYLLIEDRGMPSWASIHDDGKYNHGNTAAEGIEEHRRERVMAFESHRIEHHRVAFHQYAKAQQAKSEEESYCELR